MKKNLITLCLLIYILFAQSVYADGKDTIYIYKDDGVSEGSLTQTISTLKKLSSNKYFIKTINAQGVKNGVWAKDAALFVMPGGADLPYVAKLNGLGNSKIKQYVKEGGSFLGICAGAYYASSYVEFDKNGLLEVVGDRELKFFLGKSIGPILAPYDYKTESGSRAARIFTILKEVPEAVVYYNGGGYFENAEKYPNTGVIATYENTLPAIISINYGKGKVLLSGVHFEYDYALLDSSDHYLQKIVPDLEKHSELRKKINHRTFQNSIS